MKNYILEIKLKGLTPTVMRKVQVKEGITFRELHDIIQIVFSWGNYHMYKFTFENYNIEVTCDYEKVEAYNEYLELEKEAEEGNKSNPKFFDGLVKMRKLYKDQIKDAEYEKIDDYMKEGAKIDYIYDFGDYWHHSIKVLEIIENGEENSKILSAKGITPPDDCGGVDGYLDIKETLENEEGKDHEEMLRWAKTTGYKGYIEDFETINEKLINPIKYFDDIDKADFDMDDVISDYYED